jgi:hypothetical protein
MISSEAGRPAPTGLPLHFALARNDGSVCDLSGASVIAGGVPKGRIEAISTLNQGWGYIASVKIASR